MGSLISNILVLVASLGVIALLIALLPAPKVVRTALCALSIGWGVLWGGQQISYAFPLDKPVAPLALTRAG